MAILCRKPHEYTLRGVSVYATLNAYLCNRNAVLPKPVLGVKRRHDASAQRSPGTDSAGRPTREHAEKQVRPGILAMFLYRELRCGELCTLTVDSLHQGEGVPISASKAGAIQYAICCSM